MPGEKPLVEKRIKDAPTYSLASLLSAVSLATDLNMGQPLEHGLRCAYVGLALAAELDLPMEDREAVYYGALLKDAG